MSEAVDVGAVRARVIADISGYTTNIDKAKAKAKELGHAGHDASASFMKLNMALMDVGASSAQVQKINEALRKANPELLRKQIAEVTKELKKLGASDEDIEKITQELERSAKGAGALTRETKALGAAYSALAVAMGIVITKAIETSKTFEQSMANVKAITEATGHDFEMLRENAIKLGVSTVFSASQSADAMAELGQAGFKTNEIVAAMPGMLSLAAASQTDLATTADITSSALRGFGLEADQAARVADVLAKSAIDTNANVTDLGMSLKYVAPVAANMGISVEQAVAAIGELSNAGIKGEMAGTQLRAILLALSSPTKEAAYYMQQLGVSISDSAGNIRPLSEIIGQLQSAFTRLTQAQQADVAATLAGREAASGFITLINEGQGAFDVYTRSLQNAGGTAEEVAGTQMDTLNGAINEMQSALEGAGIAVGDTFAPAVRGVAEEVTKLLAGFNSMNPELRTMITVFATVTPLVAGGAVAVIALKTAFDTMRVAAAAAGVQMTAFSASIPIIGAVAVAVGVLSAGVAGLAARNREAAEAAKQFEDAQKKLNDTLSASPLSRTTSDVEQMKTDMKSLEQLVNNVREAERELAEEYAKPYDIQDAKARGRRKDLRDALAEAQDALKAFGVDGVDEASRIMARYTEEINKSTPALLQMNKAEIADLATKNDQVTSMEKLSARYKELNGLQTLDAAQKQELVGIANTLQKQYPELHAQIDKEGRLRIDNIEIVDGQISAEKALLSTSLSAELERISTLERTTEAQRKAVQAQIDNNISLIESIVAVNKAQAGSVLTSPDGLEDEKIYIQAKKRISAANQQAGVLDATLLEAQRARASLQGGNLDYFKGSSGTGINLTKPGSEKKEKAGKTPEELAAEARRKAFETDLATIQYQTEMFDWSADRQIQAYEKLQKTHSKYLKESTDDRRTLNLQLKRLQEDSAQSQFDFSSEWIDREERRMEESGKTEQEIARMRLDAWTRVRDRYAKDTEMYKRADEELYRARKDLTAKTIELSNDLVKTEKTRIDDAKKRELDALKKSKQAALDKYKSEIDAIDELMAKQDQLNADIDYETELREKQARADLLTSAVGPEGIQEREDLLKEIERMKLEHDRDLQKRSLEEQKSGLEKERDAQEVAFDAEISRTEAQYDALLEAFNAYGGDIKTIEAAISEFRVSEAAKANTQILTDLDAFIAQYSAKMATVTAANQAADLAEYNANKDAYDAAAARGDRAEMERLRARNQAIRDQYGITQDTGRLQSFATGGIVRGQNGDPVMVQAHAGEMVLNAQQQAVLFEALSGVSARPVTQPAGAVTQNTYNIDMGAEEIVIEDSATARQFFDERARVVQRLQTEGVKTR
ncbi:phage tail tape measure protein [Paenibacillus timonensis]|uniref:Phage tail tape measure protein n=1 Tax=Paenibacillus timonensis TaxID=225915 RepID=A0ABW3SEK5_9BACL|nr:phage tail tape measure protein [Paenibacillus timonensis]MCH1641814.1 phage tail tape measure protein [Paenibacillus timonensis]